MAASKEAFANHLYSDTVPVVWEARCGSLPLALLKFEPGALTCSPRCGGALLMPSPVRGRPPDVEGGVFNLPPAVPYFSNHPYSSPEDKAVGPGTRDSQGELDELDT
jgi:hypothetical protein